ncbi:monocarboxylate transporter 12-B-like [Gasterosteus aculeatus]
MSVTDKEKLEGGRRSSGVTTPPEGGWGWMIVAGCFLSTICIRAVTRCVSMFFVEFQLHFGKDYSTTAWIHSLIDCTTMLCAPLGGLLAHRLSCRTTVMLGGLISSFGLVLSSFACSLEFLYASLGVVTGLGFALSYTPAVAMVGTYFSERKALAYGVAMSGSGIGTFVLAPAVQLLIERYSWRGALLVLGGLVSNLCVCGALMRPLEPSAPPRFKGPKGSKVAECVLFSNELTETMPGGTARSDPEPPRRDTGQRDAEAGGVGPPAEPPAITRTPWEEYGFLLIPDFLVLSASFLFLAYGCSAPVVYLVPFALGVGVGDQRAAFLMSLFGVSGIVGNVTFGWIADRKCLRRYRVMSYAAAIGMEGLCCMLLHLLRSFSLLLSFSLLYGYFDGAYVALIPVVTSDVVDSSYLTSALGVVYFLHAIPYLISPPIGGWLVDITGNYAATFSLSGASFMFSSVILAAAMLAGRLRAAAARQSLVRWR